ncbi:hypothetical protein N7523_003131 [Penicillium sp. IBT 18751x]|nr:hypothetical protein N7523_003131 [Penicillium sp. IBT 18751x]
MGSHGTRSTGINFTNEFTGNASNWHGEEQSLDIGENQWRWREWDMWPVSLHSLRDAPMLRLPETAKFSSPKLNQSEEASSVGVVPCLQGVKSTTGCANINGTNEVVLRVLVSLDTDATTTIGASGAVVITQDSDVDQVVVVLDRVCLFLELGLGLVGLLQGGVFCVFANFIMLSILDTNNMAITSNQGSNTGMIVGKMSVFDASHIPVTEG